VVYAECVIFPEQHFAAGGINPVKSDICDHTIAGCDHKIEAWVGNPGAEAAITAEMAASFLKSALNCAQIYFV
jgi:hypothetical protein